MKKLLLFSFFAVFVSNNIYAQCDGTLPVTEDFNTNNIGVCWNLVDQDGDLNDWMWWEYSSYYGGHKVIASYSFYTSTGALTPDNWIISFPIDLTSYSGSDNIQLSWKVRGELSGFSHEYYSIYAASNNQITDFESSDVKRSEFVDEVGGDATWVTRSLDISSLAGNTVYIAFRHHNSTNQYNINIDDVSISTEALSLEDVEIDGFKHFYNSANNQLTVSSTQVPMTSINIFNILGQNVFSKTPTTNTRESINLADVNKGIYIAKISFENVEKTFKFIKH